MMRTETLVKDQPSGMISFRDGSLFEAWLAKREITLGGFDASKFSGPSALSSWLAARP